MSLLLHREPLLRRSARDPQTPLPVTNQQRADVCADVLQSRDEKEALRGNAEPLHQSLLLKIQSQDAVNLRAKQSPVQTRSLPKPLKRWERDKHKGPSLQGQENRS